MFPLIKFLKITLPVATVTSATVATALLVSSGKKDTEEKKNNNNLILKNFEKIVEEFQQKKIFYSDKGTANGEVNLSEKDSQKIEEHLKNGVEVSDKGTTQLDEIKEPKNQTNTPATQEETVDNRVLLPQETSLKTTEEPNTGEKNSISFPETPTISEQQEKSTKENDEELPKGSEGNESADEQELNGAQEQKEPEDAAIPKDPIESKEEEISAPSDTQDQHEQGEDSLPVAEEGREQTSESSQDGLEKEASTSGSIENLKKLIELQDKLSHSRDELGAILESLTII